MTSRRASFTRAGRGPAAVLLVPPAGAHGCGLDEVDIPDTSTGRPRPASRLRLTAVPDIITADGFSTSLVQVDMRDQNGRPVERPRHLLRARRRRWPVRRPRHAAGDGRPGRRHGPRSCARTRRASRRSSTRRRRARTPPPTRPCWSCARPVGSDANAAVYRSVRIELRSAEPRLFPQNPDNASPVCNFIVEPPNGPYRVNQPILFQSTSFDPDGTIVRYAGTSATARGPIMPTSGACLPAPPAPIPSSTSSPTTMGGQAPVALTVACGRRR